MFSDFYAGRRVLVTGHTGFKGGWLSLWLNQLGASVHGLSLEPPTSPNLHDVIREKAFASESHCDVCDLNALQSAMAHINPEVIFHLAAQSLVRLSYEQPIETFRVNTLGVANLLEATRRLEGPWTILVITSDKCYQERRWPYGYRENDTLGGHDLYSISKAAAELVVEGWRKSCFQTHPKLGRLATARAGNVIGGGDYARDRLVPDCVRALLENRPIPVRNPSAVRPWQHVLDCLSGYLWLAAQLARGPKDSPLASGFNFGPLPGAGLPVAAVVDEMLRCWPGRWEAAPQPDAPHEAPSLNLAIDKAANLLGWSGVWGLREAVSETVGWYRARHLDKVSAMVSFTEDQIARYQQAAQRKGAVWTRNESKA